MSENESNFSGQNNTIVGDWASFGGFNDAFVFGDNQIAHSDGCVVVGDTLFGKPIPENLKQFAMENPADVAFLVRSIAGCRLLVGDGC